MAYDAGLIGRSARPYGFDTRGLQYDGVHDAERETTFDMVRASVLANITAGSPARAEVADRLGGVFGRPTPGKPTGPHKQKVCVFSKRDSRRHLANAEDVGRWLMAALPHAQVDVTHSFNDMTFHDQAWYFYTCDALIAPHGGWIPNVMFMRPDAIVFILAKHPGEARGVRGAKTWRSEAATSYRVWDSGFHSRTRHVLLVVNGSRDDVAKHASDDTRVVIEDMAWDGVDVDDQAAPDVWLLGIENIVLRIRHHVAVDS